VKDAARHPFSKILELLIAVQVAVFIVGVSWAFGGNADWVRTPISIWGTLGVLLTTIIVVHPGTRKGCFAGTLGWCLPVVALNLLVLVSCLTPGFKSLAYGSETVLMPLRVAWWVPSSARPAVSLKALWLFDGVYFSCFNVALHVFRRRIIRILLAATVANGFALSVFGTVQKLMNSTGIYFDSVPSPQDYFFASFVYDNHWGAFITLVMGACFGLMIRYLMNPDGGGFARGPAFSGLVAAFIIGISVPLSGSRACTLLLGFMTVVALKRGAPALSNAMRSSGVSAKQMGVSIILTAAIAGWGAWTIAGDVIDSRAAKAKEQIAQAWALGSLGARGILYHDTWRMAEARPVFGWGMGSFPSVFALYNTQVPKGDRIPVVYHDAHSDWIQSVAETGFVGTVLIGSAVALPALAIRRKRITPIPYFLFAGILLVAAYAWVEFPFGNVAVVLTWWYSFFCAVQYLRLSNSPESAPRHPQ
jgi:O-antigen ligase